MEKFHRDGLSETSIVCFSHSDPSKVTLRTKVEGVPEPECGVVTTVRANNGGDLLYSWPRYGVKGEEHYEPPLELMVALQEQIRQVLVPHIRDGAIDRKTFDDSLPWSGGHWKEEAA